MKLKIKNTTHQTEVDVRIIRVSASTVFENTHDQFEPMDAGGNEFGLFIGPAFTITCTGSGSMVGEIQIGLPLSNGPEPLNPNTTLEINDVNLGTFNDPLFLQEMVLNNNAPDLQLAVYPLLPYTPNGSA